jgi:hypothetical protein
MVLDLGTNNPTVNVSGNIIIDTTDTGPATITRAGAITNLSIGGDWIISGAASKIYIKGAAGASITLNGTGTQNVDFSAGDIEDLIIDKNSGKVIFTGNWITESFLAVDGELDFNGQTVQTTGDFTINAANGTDVNIVSDADAMNAADITVGNDFYISNITMNATDTWYLDVQGSSALAFDVNVEYSNANAGLPVNANAFGNIDLGENYNWNFGTQANIQSITFHCFSWARMTNRSIRGFRRG